MVNKILKKSLSFALSTVLAVSAFAFVAINPAKADTTPWTAKYDFGTGDVETGYTQVLPTDVYTAVKGYGFLRTTGELANINIDGFRNGTTFIKPTAGGDASVDKLNGDFIEAIEPDGIDKKRGDYQISFAARVPTQNQTYDVKVVIGRNDKDMRLNLSTEKKHFLYYDEFVPKGTYITKEFTVSVQNQTYKGDGAFTDTTISIAAWGDNVCINSLEITENPNRNTIWMLGDSTMGDCLSSSPVIVYGEMASYGAGLSKYVGLGYGVANYSQGGLNSTDMAGTYFSQFSGRIKAGDYVIMASGHNDAAADEYFKNNFRSVADKTIARGATFIATSPIERTVSYSNGQYQFTLGAYRDAIKAVAIEKDSPFIDLNTLVNAEYNRVGNPAAQYFMWNHWGFASDGVTPKFGADYTHPSPKGTDMITGNFAKEVKRLVNENNAKVAEEQSAAVAKLNPLFASLNNEQINYPTQELMMDGSDAIKAPSANSNYPKAIKTTVVATIPLVVKDVAVGIDDDENRILKTISVQKDIALDEYGHIVAAFYDKDGYLLKVAKRNSDPTIGVGSLEVIDYNVPFPANTDTMKVYAFDGMFFEPANPNRELGMSPVAKPFTYNKIERYLMNNEDFKKYSLLPNDSIVTGSNGVWVYEASSSPIQTCVYGEDADGTGYAKFAASASGSYWFGSKFASTAKISSGKAYFNANIRPNANKASISLTTGGTWKNYLAGVSFSLNAVDGKATAGGISLDSVVTKGKWYNVTYIVDLTNKTNELTVKDLATGQVYTGTGSLSSVPVDLSTILVSGNSTAFDFDINNITFARLRDPIPPIEYTTNFTVKNNEDAVVPNAIITISGTTAHGIAVTNKVVNADANGLATTTMVNGDYTYMVTGANHDPLQNQTFTISKAGKDIAVTLTKSVAPKYTVTFAPKDTGSNAITGVTTVLTDTKYNLLVDANTDGSYSLANGTYSYVVSKTGYKTVIGTFTVADVNMSVDTEMLVAYMFDDFSGTGNWGMTQTGRTGVMTIASGVLTLGLNSDTTNGPTVSTKVFTDTTVTSAKKMELNFDWLPKTEISKGRSSALEFKDTSGALIFGINQNGTSGLSYSRQNADLTITTTNFSAYTSTWQNIKAILDFDAKTVTLTITNSAGTKVLDNVTFATNATALNSMVARDGYSLADMALDNFGVFEAK